MIRKIRQDIGEFLRSTAALVVVLGFLSALAVTVTVGSLLRDGEEKKHRTNLPTATK
jgi:hypothetical protein